MLTPAATDPNRQKELERQKQDPKSFGDKPALPKDWKEDQTKRGPGRPRKGE